MREASLEAIGKVLRGPAPEGRPDRTYTAGPPAGARPGDRDPGRRHRP
ncbi:hypothetical protein [Streptomyces lydicus]|nr:hypothetical protein [Streptomyces lydicus]